MMPCCGGVPARVQEGDSAKRVLDAMVDAASVLINLRVAIMK